MDFPRKAFVGQVFLSAAGLSARRWATLPQRREFALARPPHRLPITSLPALYIASPLLACRPRAASLATVLSLRGATLQIVAFYRDERGDYRVTELDAIPWLIHGFGTRDSDIPGRFSHLATVKQIHSAECLPAEGRTGVVGHADALLEDTPGAVVAVKTADCVPILMVDEARRAVAAVHAGWRGTAARIAQRAVEAMKIRFGSAPEDLHAALGPAIGECCFEVGPEVAEQFGRHGRVHVDLESENRAQLLQAGVTGRRIYASKLCTMCEAGEFHSYRRDREGAGRMYSFVGLDRAVE